MKSVVLVLLCEVFILALFIVLIRSKYFGPTFQFCLFTGFGSWFKFSYGFGFRSFFLSDFLFLK